MQRIVVMSGLLMGLSGLLMICLVPTSWAWRLPGCVLCVVVISSELYQLRRAWRSYSCARLAHDGTAALRNADGRWRPAELLPGCLLLRHFGWIRLQTRDGHRFAALYRGHCRHSADWRRLQVIWRHIGATG